MSEALGNLLERRSIRAYKPEQISEDELQSVLKAGLLRPVCNEQTADGHARRSG